MKNKFTQLLQLALISSSVLAANSAHATLAPFDLVSYDENKATHVLALSPDQAHIIVYECPQNEWISSLKQCSNPSAVLSASDFEAFVKRTIAISSKKRVALAPLSVEDVKALSVIYASENDPRLAHAKNELADAQASLQKTSNMLEHMPNSTAYQQQKKDLEDKISSLNSELANAGVNQNSSLQKLVTDLSASMFKLISENNPKDGTLNSFARSQMTNTLLDQVVQELIHTAPIDLSRPISPVANLSPLAKACITAVSRLKQIKATTPAQIQYFCENTSQENISILLAANVPIAPEVLDFTRKLK